LAQARLLPFTGWGSSAGDFNNDGFLDLYVGNGMKMPDTDTNFVAQAQQNSLFINQRNGQFKLSNGTNAAQHPYSSRGVISVDLNNDGTLEVLVSNNNDSLQILENQVSNEHTWFGLDLLSKNVPSDAYGAVVEVSTDLFTFKRTFGANQSFLSQGDPRVHIGLGDSKHIKSLNIRWPDGQVSTFENLKTNQYFTIGRTDNTLSPIQGEQTELTHKSPLLKQLNEAALIAYSKVLLQAPIGKTRNKLWQVWREGSDSVKSSILRHIEQHGDMHYVSLVRNALVNHDVDVQLLAAKILKQAELESSIVWLLPLLNDPKPPVQCATAQAFGFFFDEEEAVTHRKKLAISPLIKLLESGSPTAQVCAANALANAENKRAILPLLKLSTESAPTQVRTAAIRALGLIRDTSAREKLITLVQTPESKAPVVAASLIALNRLNEPTLDTLMSTHFNHDKDTTIKAWSILKRYQILSFLFTHPDGIVFPKRQLREKLTRLIKQDSSQRNITKLLNQKHLIAAFIAIGAGKLTSQLSFVESGLKHKDRDVQVQALTALVALNSPKASYLLEQTLSNQALNVFHEFISKSKSTSLPFSEKFLSQLAIRAADKPKQIDQLIELLLALPDNTANRLFNTLLTQELSIAQRQQLLEICVSEDATLSLTTQLTASEVRSKYPSDELRYAYANCYLNSPQPKNGNLTQLKKRLVLKSFMAETAWDEHSKTKLLLKAAETDRVTAKTMLLKRVLSSNTRPMPASQKAKALDVLAHHGLTSDIKEILWAMLKNTQLSHQTQLEAAALLTPIDAEAVLNFLDKQFYTP
jgi:HEAT repeat protein